MLTVTASEFSRNFGRFKEIAQREPVTVTSSGRDSVVLISAKEFEAFRRSKYAYGGALSEEFERDAAAHFDDHDEVHEGLSR